MLRAARRHQRVAIKRSLPTSDNDVTASAARLSVNETEPLETNVYMKRRIGGPLI